MDLHNYVRLRRSMVSPDHLVVLRYYSSLREVQRPGDLLLIRRIHTERQLSALYVTHLDLPTRYVVVAVAVFHLSCLAAFAFSSSARGIYSLNIGEKTLTSTLPGLSNRERETDSER